ncbi:MAG TPA: hypothetical protein VEU08_19505 [Vicinamibacterales bacterium]|nr:hypothetical protein [Vicinamibacterales bacterium]
MGAVLGLLFVLYVESDPSTHIGAFYGNALADWLGTFVIVLATKYFYEIGSLEQIPASTRPAARRSFSARAFAHDRRPATP